MTSRSTLAFVLLLLAPACQSDDGTPSAAPGEGESAQATSGCTVSPDTLDFGRVITPPFGWEEDYATLPFTIRNEGDSLFSGRVDVNVEPTGPRRATFALTPSDADPVFSIAPGDSVTFVLGVTMENASGGAYTGAIALGTECKDIIIRMTAVPSQ